MGKEEQAILRSRVGAHGFCFIGPTTAYAFTQAMGLVNDHLEGCAARERALSGRAHSSTRPGRLDRALRAQHETPFTRPVSAPRNSRAPLARAGLRPRLRRRLASGEPVIVPWLASRGEDATPDPFAQAELARDLRPPDYATSFLRQATQLSGLARPISVCAVERPEWLHAVVADPEVEETTLEAALAYCATVE